MGKITKPSTVLNKAADLLVEEGWVKGALMCKKGKHCAMGAMAAITGELVPRDDWRYDFGGKEMAEEIDEMSPLLSESTKYLATAINPEYAVAAHFSDDLVWINLDNMDIVTSMNDDQRTRRVQVVKKMREAAELAKKDKR